MTLLEKLDCNLEEGKVINFCGPKGSGITSILCIIASELAISGKNVIYVNNDTKYKFIVNKFNNLVPEPTELKGTINISATNNIGKLINDSKNVDVVIIDSYYGNKINYKTFAENNKLTIIEMKQLNLNSKSEPISKFYEFGFRNDFIIGVSRNKTVKKLSVLDKIKNKFCFWIPEIIEMENITLNVIKNRRGRIGSILYPVNFQEINK